MYSQFNLADTRLIVDNAKEFISKDVRAICVDFKVELSTTAEYKHTDNAMIESYWRNEQMVRSMLLGAPHTDKRLWPYAWTLATKLHNFMHGQGTLAKTDVMQRSPYETVTGIKPPLHGFKPFGLPMKIHIPVEKRKMCSDPKLIARSFTGFYLCPDPKAPTKILVQAEDTGNIVSTGFYQPMYSVDSASRIVSNAGLRNTIDLDRITEATLKSQISNNKISSRKSVSAERIFDVSVIEDDNKELLGVLEIKDALAKENIWVTLPVFLAGNVDKVYTHKNMLYEFLNRHFQSRANNFYPIFVFKVI